MTASRGIAISDHTVPERDLDADRLLREADAAMYHAKSLGGSRPELFDPDNPASNVEGPREGWLRQIRDALDEYRFVLHAQPIVELGTGAVVQHELLLRMRDGDGALIPPLAFLPTAESSGLISEIDDWVIFQATKIAAGGQPVAVNLFAASAGDPRVLDLMERELRQHRDRSREPGVRDHRDRSDAQHGSRSAFTERLVALGSASPWMTSGPVSPASPTSISCPCST